MSDIKLDVIADILLKGGTVDSSELDKLIQLHLKNQKFPDILLDPKVKLGNNTVASAKAQLEKLATELKHMSLGALETVSDATQKSYGKYNAEQQQALSGLFKQLNTTLATASQSEKFSGPFIEKMNAIHQGIGSVFKLDENEKRLAKEYVNHISQTQGQLQSVLSKASSVNKKFHSGDVGGTATPLILSGLGAKVSESASYISKLKNNLNEEALLSKAQVEAAKQNRDVTKQRAAAVAEANRVRGEETRGIDKHLADQARVNKDYDTAYAERQRIEDKAAAAAARIERGKQNARERQERDAKAEAGRYHRASLGEASIKSAGGLDGLSKIGRAQLPDVALAVKDRVKELDKQLTELASNNAFGTQGGKIKQLQEELSYLNSKLKETNSLINARPKAARVAQPGNDGFVGPVYDRVKDQAFSRAAYGGELLEQAGGERGVRNVAREHLPLVKEHLESRLTGLRDKEALTSNFDSKDSRAEWSKLSGEIQRTEDALRRVTTAQSGFGSATQQTGALFRQFFRYALGYGALYQVLAGVRALIGGIVDLDSALKNIQAVTGGTQKAMNGIEAAIKRTALATNFSVKEIAKAGQILAQAGVKPDQFTSALSAVATFASATETSIDTAADLVSTMRTVYSELDDLAIANQLTKAVNISKLTGEELKVILSLGAQTASSYGIASEQYLAAVTVLRNAGIKASTVATGLRQGILEMLSPDEKTLKVLEKRYKDLGENLSQNAIKGKFFSFGQAENPLLEALKEYRRLGFAGSAKKDFARVFDVRAQNAILPLIKDIEGLVAAETELTFGNTALKAARTQMEALAASAKNLGASIVVLTSNLSGGAVEGLESMADAATDTIKKITELDATLKASTATGVLTSLATGVAAGSLAAVADRGGIGSKVAKFAVGTVAGTAAGSVGQEVAGKAGGGEGAATVASVVGSMLTVLAFIPGIGGKLKDTVSKLPLIGSVFTGIYSFILKLGHLLGAVTPLGRVVTGVLATAGVAYTALKYLNENKLDTAKAKLEQALKNSESAKAARQETLDEQNTFRLSSSGRPASEGSTAASVEKLKVDSANYKAEVERIVGTGADKLAAVTAALVQLNKYGYEADSPASQLLIDKVQDLTDKKIAVDADSRKKLLELAENASLLTSQSEHLRSSIAADAALLLEAKDTLSPVEQAFLDAHSELLATDSRDALLGTAKVLPEEMAAIAEAMLDNLNSKVEQSSAVKDQIKAQADAEKQKIDNIISLLALSEKPEDVANQLTLLLGSADDLGTEAITFISKLRDNLDIAIAGLRNEGIAAKIDQWLGLGDAPDLDELLAKQKQYRDTNQPGGPAEGQSPLPTPYDSKIATQRQAANLGQSRELTSAFLNVAKLGQANANKDKTSETAVEREVLQAYLSSAAFKKVQPGLDDSTKVFVEKFQSGKEDDLVPARGDDGKPTGYLTEGDTFLVVKKLVEAMTLSNREEDKEPTADYVESSTDFGKKLEADNAIAAAKDDKSESLVKYDQNNPIIQKRDLELKTKGEEIANLQAQLDGASGDNVETLEKKLLQAQNDLVKIVGESEGDIQDAGRALADEKERQAKAAETASNKTKADAERHRNKEKKAKNDYIKALEHEIDIALDTGDLEAVQRLDAERITVMEERNRKELESLVASGESADLIQETKDTHADELRLAKEQNLATARIIGALDNKYERLTVEDTVSGNNIEDGYRKASGVEFRDSQKLKTLDSNIPNDENFIKELEAMAANPANSSDQVRDYENRIRAIEQRIGEQQYERDQLTNTGGQELAQGFDADAIAAGVENLDGAMKNLGENIQSGVVDGIDNIAGAFSSAIVHSENFFEATRQAAAAAMRDIASMIIKSGILKLGAMVFGGGFFSEGGVVEAKANGGVIKAAKGYVGGVIKGRGTGKSDSISGVVVDARGRATRGIRVSNKEAILTANAVSTLGEDFVNMANTNPQKVAEMLKAYYSNPIMRAAGGAVSKSASKTSAGIKAPNSSVEYNHSTSVSVEGDNSGVDPQNLTMLSRIIDSKVKGIIQDQKRPGGLLSRH